MLSRVSIFGVNIFWAQAADTGDSPNAPGPKRVRMFPLLAAPVTCYGCEPVPCICEVSPHMSAPTAPIP